MENSEFICESELKSLHKWTSALIKNYLGEPDMTVPNPHCPSGNRRIKLYSRQKVKGFESDPNFQEDFFKAKKRQ